MQIGETTPASAPTTPTHGVVCNFGRWKGTLYTRIPVSYLLWIVNSGCEAAPIADAELKRRGTVLPKLDISGHALDRASLRLWKAWEADRGPEEGVHGWLVRMASEALKTGLNAQGVAHYKGIKFVFENMEIWPVLKTVMPDQKFGR